MKEHEYIVSILNRIDAKETLREYEIRDLLEYEIARHELEPRRWMQGITSLVKLSERYFIINWDKGLTENQEDEYPEQPIEAFSSLTKETNRFTSIIYGKNGAVLANFSTDIPEEIVYINA